MLKLEAAALSKLSEIRKQRDQKKLAKQSPFTATGDLEERPKMSSSIDEEATFQPDDDDQTLDADKTKEDTNL